MINQEEQQTDDDMTMGICMAARWDLFWCCLEQMIGEHSMNRQYQIGDVVFQQWTITDKIGEGSFGKVYQIRRCYVQWRDS